MRLILPAGPCGLFEGASPEELAASHPLWAEFAARAAPWTRTADEAVCPGGEAFTARTDDADGDDSRRPEPAAVVVRSCQSAFEVAHDLARRQVLRPFDGVLAVTQEQGRGQYRRSWHSPAGNLHACLVLPPMSPCFDRLAPLWAGLAAVRALRGGLARPDVLLKWPNDILLGGRKVAGILLEERGGLLVAGIGVNVAKAPDPGVLRADTAVEAADLGAPGPAGGLLGLWQALVKTTQKLYGIQLRSSTPALLVREVNQVLAWKGERVAVQADDDPQAGTFEAFLIGVAEDGSLDLVRADGGGRTRCASGGVRPAP